MAEDPINQQQFAEDVAAAAGEDGFSQYSGADGNVKMPSIDELLNMIEEMDGISDEDKAALKESIYNPQGGSASAEYLKRLAVGHTSWEYIIFLAMIVVLVLIFGKNNEN